MANKRETENRNPANGELIGTYPLDSAEAARGKIAAARAAQASWASLSYGKRSACVKRLGGIVAARAEELAAAISANNGKTLVDAMATEVLPAVLAVG
jgi:acyl-CoA reductase-like NAD-dependent aldehyde dehydrogenase